MPREKSRHRNRRSSSSDSSYERRRSKTKHKRRSRSHDRSESSSSRRRRSVSRSRHRRKTHSRSLSRDRYKKSKRSPSRTRYKRSKRVDSRDRSHSRSVSQSRSRHGKSKKKSKRRSRSSSSQSSSFDIERPLPSYINLDDTEEKLEKAIKAAQAVGLTMTKIPTFEYKEVEIKEDMPTIHDRNLIDELNSDSFVQRSFLSSKSKKQQNIVIDLNSQTVKMPESEIKVEIDDSIIKINEIPSVEELREMWIKKLYQFRKKMLKGDI